MRGIGMIRAEGKEMKADEVDGMAEATAAVSERSKAADSARGIIKKEEFRCWRESRGCGLESSWQQRRSLRWSRSEGGVEMAAGSGGGRTTSASGEHGRHLVSFLLFLRGCFYCCSRSAAAAHTQHTHFIQTSHAQHTHIKHASDTCHTHITYASHTCWVGWEAW